MRFGWLGAPRSFKIDDTVVIATRIDQVGILCLSMVARDTELACKATREKKNNGHSDCCVSLVETWSRQMRTWWEEEVGHRLSRWSSEALRARGKEATYLARGGGAAPLFAFSFPEQAPLSQL